MQSISASSYRGYVKSFVLEALRRPNMFYRELRELELMVHGFESAFLSIGAVSRVNWFSSCIYDWLWEQYKTSSADGWSRGVTRLAVQEGIVLDGAESEGVDLELNQFTLELFEDFFEEWCP